MMDRRGVMATTVDGLSQEIPYVKNNFKAVCIGEISGGEMKKGPRLKAF